MADHCSAPVARGLGIVDPKVQSQASTDMEDSLAGGPQYLHANQRGRMVALLLLDLHDGSHPTAPFILFAEPPMGLAPVASESHTGTTKQP